MPELSPRGREIVRTARDLLEREGPDGLTMRALAARIGIRASSLYKHLPGKGALQGHVVALGLAELGAALAATSTARDPLAEYLRAYRRFARARPALYRLMTETAEGEMHDLELHAAAPLLRIVGSARRARAVWAFAHGLCQLELAGRFPPEADLDGAWDAGAEAFARISRTSGS
ncbi:MAG: TetR/AcrR family transcriptional regulator [Gaiellaceae bacterium]